MNREQNQTARLQQLGTGSGAEFAAQESRASGRAGAEEKPLIRLNLRRALQLHRRLALGFALAGLLLAVVYVALSWPVYQAESQLYVQPVQTRVLASGSDSGQPINPAAYDSFVQQQVQSASNPEVLANAMHKLGPGKWQKKDEIEQAAAERLGHAVEVARVGTSFEVAITARAKDPMLAANIANAVAQSIVERASGEGNAGDAQRITVLQEERDRIQSELKADYAEQDDLNKQLGMAAVGTAAPDLIDDQIARTREELIKAQTDHDQAEARFSSMQVTKGGSSAAIDAEADDLIAADAGLASMKTSLNQRRATLITQMANLTPSNPAYKQDAEELAKINSSLDAMMRDLRTNATARIQAKLRTDLERTARVEAQLNTQLGQLARTAASATPKLQRVSDLATDIVRLRNRYSLVDEQLHNVMLQDSVPGAVHLSVTAIAPLHPAVGRILKKVLPLLLGGLILGLLAAVIANKLDPRIYIAADVEDVLGFGPTAVLPNFLEVPDEVAAEHLLRVASTIEHARQQGQLKSCIFTGTASGVGVTTLVSRVKEILVAMGRPAAVLDPTKTPLPEPNYGANRVAPAWKKPATLRGSRSTALVRQITAQAEQGEKNLVLTDAAPLAVSAETEHLARSVDGVIVVIESGVTTRAQLRAAAETLRRLDVRIVGFVLNRVGLAKADPAFHRSIQEMEEHLGSRAAAAQPPSKALRPVGEESTGHAEFHAGKDAYPESVRILPEPAAHNKEVKQSAPESTQETPDMQPPQEPAQDSPGERADGSARKPRADSVRLEPASGATGKSTEAEPQPRLAERTNASDTDKHTERVDETQSSGAASVTPFVNPWWLKEKPEKTEESHERPDEDESPRPLPMRPGLLAEPLPDWIWEEPASGRGGFAHFEKADIDEEKHAPRRSPRQASSRLNELRGMMSSLRLRKLGRQQNAQETDDKLPTRQREEPSETSIFVPRGSTPQVPSPIAGPEVHTGTPVAPAPGPAPAVTRPAAEPARKQVVAQPEYLPPKEFVPVKETNQGENESADRGDDPGLDDIRILPSRRGQYRR